MKNDGLSKFENFTFKSINAGYVSMIFSDKDDNHRYNEDDK